MAAKRLRYVALALGAAWACWWVSFETAEAIGDRQFTQAILFLVVMFGAVALAWKWMPYSRRFRLPSSVIQSVVQAGESTIRTSTWCHPRRAQAAMMSRRMVSIAGQP